MREGGAHEIEIAFGCLQRAFLGREEHRGAVYVRARREVLGPDLAEDLRVGERGHENGKASVIAAAGGGADAFGDFQLDHAHEAFREVEARHETRDNRGRHVVGEVSRYPRFFVRVEECLQVEFQEVDIYDMEVLAAPEFFLQKFDALLVDFDGSEFHGAIQQVFREGAVAGADFQNVLARFCRQVSRNHLCGRYIQKVLAEFATACSIHNVKDRNIFFYKSPWCCCLEISYLYRCLYDWKNFKERYQKFPHIGDA